MQIDQYEMLDAIIDNEPDFIFREFSDFKIFSVAFGFAIIVFTFQLFITAAFRLTSGVILLPTGVVLIPQYNYILFYVILDAIIWILLYYYVSYTSIKKNFLENDASINHYRCKSCEFSTFSAVMATIHGTTYPPHQIQEKRLIVHMERRKLLKSCLRRLINRFKRQKTKPLQDSDIIKRTDEKRRIPLKGSIKYLIGGIVLLVGFIVVGYFAFLYIAFSHFPSPLSYELAIIFTIGNGLFLAPLLALMWYRLERRHPVVHLINLEYKEAEQYLCIRIFIVGLDYWKGMRQKLTPVKTPYGDYYVVRLLILNRYGKLIEVH